MFVRTHTPRRALAPLIILGTALLGAGSVQAHFAADRPEPATVKPLDACPVSGSSEFVDSWGDARSSGRRHEGVDMAAGRGTPVTAVRDGQAEFKRSSLGGNAIWLLSNEGERFYYAHLDAFEGESRSVEAGEIIGYVGSTGNAGGNDHLHFETRAGQRAVNPYSYVVDLCESTTAGADIPIAVRPRLR